MRIAMLSYLPGKPVPPVGYGGIERVVSTLSNELVRQGHDVTLIAPEGSILEGGIVINVSDFNQAMGYITRYAYDLDIIHDHSCWSLESPVRHWNLPLPFISTTHVMHAIGWTKNVVYLSMSQRYLHAKQVNPMADTYDLKAPVVRVPTSPLLKPKGLERQEYLLYLGSVQPHKGVISAAVLANILGRPLLVAGPAAGEYADKVKAMPGVVMLGEVQDPFRSDLIEQAYAVCCLHNDLGGWSEPGCGIVGEAGALNTPVAALNNGCLNEIVLDGDNGWIAHTTEELAMKMLRMNYPTNPGHLATVEWSASRVTKQYLEIYERVCAGETWE